MSKRFSCILEAVLNDPNGVKMPKPLVGNLNRCLSHVNELLSSVIILCKNSCFCHALFLAITAVEEATKAEIYCFRNHKENNGRASKDCLKKHDIKHKVAVNEDLLIIGKRVQEVIGEELTIKIYDDFIKGKAREVRENCLYFDIIDDSLVIPNTNIEPQLALAYILVCIEIIDDKIVGWTDYSMELSKYFDQYFNEIKMTIISLDDNLK